MGQSLRGAPTMSDDTLPSLPGLPSHALDQSADLADACAARTGQWLEAAINPRSFDARLFAKLIAAREVRGEWALLGLSPAQWSGLVGRHFKSAPVTPGLTGLSRFSDAVAMATVAALTVDTHEHVEFATAMRALMLRYASPAVLLDDAQCLATIIAHACLRPDHLWRDLGLAGRDEVSAMLERYFPSLAALNVENLRWKKFLAQQLALSLGREPGPAPGCPGCEDYGFCFPRAP